MRQSLAQFSAHQKKAVKLNRTFSRSKYLSILGYGALPHRPTKGLSARPLETFGRKYFVLFLKYRYYELDNPPLSSALRRFDHSSD